MGFRVCRVSVGAGARGAGGGGGTGGDLRTGPGFGKSVAIMATTGVDNCVKLHFHLGKPSKKKKKKYGIFHTWV